MSTFFLLNVARNIFRDEIDVAARAGGDVGETVAQTGVVTYAGQEQGGSSMGNGGIYRYAE